MLVMAALAAGCSSSPNTPTDAGSAHCTSASDCASSNPCVTATCDAAQGKCVETPVADGTVPAGTQQTAGDCQKLACVAGVLKGQTDPSDLPTATNDCVTPSCSGGAPSTPPRDADAPCSTWANNQPGFCDGNGHCVQCTRADECAGPVDNCQHPVCNDGVCTTEFTPNETPTIDAPPQQPGDCRTIVCDGNGGTTAITNDEDLPADLGACFFGSCTNGTPGQKQMPAGTVCDPDNSLVCNATGDCGCRGPGDCVAPATCGGEGIPLVCGCLAASCEYLGRTCGAVSDGCYSTLDCNNSLKDGSETDVDCGGADAQCSNRCAQGKRCLGNSDCGSGFCVDGVCCNTACDGACEACSSSKKGAGPDGVCGAIQANTDPDNECDDEGAASCGQNGSCNGAGACALYGAGTNCAAASCAGTTLTPARTCDGQGTCQSASTTSCAPYTCGVDACRTTCAVDVDCAAGSYCNTLGQCASKAPQGFACTASNQCQTGYCIDGYCCDTACNGTCEACSALKNGSGINGVCIAIMANTDPDNECADQGAASCGTTGSCNGTRACSLYPPGTMCTESTCSGSTFTPARTCNGTGTCQTPQPNECSSGTCNASGCQ
jgi:hypothetical protein